MVLVLMEPDRTVPGTDNTSEASKLAGADQGGQLMIFASLQQAGTRLRGGLVAGFSALACLLVVSTSHSSFSVGLPRRDQNQDAVTKASQESTKAILELRSVIGELEAQVEVERVQIQKLETSLRQARAILSELERSEATGDPNRNQPRSRTWIDPNDPMREETLSKQALAEKTQWAWPLETATPQDCARNFGGGYDVEIAQPKEPSSPTMVQVCKDGNDVVTWRADTGSVFVRGSDVVYRAEFSPYASGCSAVAYHLKRGELWKTPLWGIGPMGNSMYTNRVNMKLDGDYLIVYGDESAGRYIQLVDIRTGRIVGASVSPAGRDFGDTSPACVSLGRGNTGTYSWRVKASSTRRT